MVRGFFNRWTYLDDGILHPPDFALFRIASPVTLTPYIGLIRLPSMEWEPNTWEGRATVISGWGGQHSMEPRFLQYGNFVIVSDDICRIRNNSHVVCAEPVGHSDLAMSTLGGARGNWAAFQTVQWFGNVNGLFIRRSMVYLRRRSSTFDCHT